MTTAERLIRLSTLMTVVALSACNMGGDDDETAAAAAPAAAAPAPGPAAPAPAGTASCGTMTALSLSALDAYAGTYAVQLFESSSSPTADPLQVGSATLTVTSGQVAYVPADGTANASSVTAAALAVCQNTDAGGAPIGVTVMFSGDHHVDFFSPAFSGLLVSGDDLGNTGTTYRYMQSAVAAPSPAPAPSAGPAPAGALTSYLDFSAAAPTTSQIAPAGALAWLAGTYYGRSSAGQCSVTVSADGSASATMNGNTQSAALDGQSNDTWLQLPSNAMSFAVTLGGTAQAIVLSGFAGRLTTVELAGVLDKCAIAFKSSTALSMATASAAPLPLMSSGLLAADLPGWLVGTHSGHVAGTPAYPQTASAACSLQVAADGTAVLNANGRSYTAQVSGGAGSSTSGDRDSSAASRQSVYAALTGAQNWLWSLKAQSPSGSDTVEVAVELAYTPERSQVTYAVGQVRPSAGGAATQLDACYFPN